MKVFLDVGAHLGETLEVVQDRRWGFERIVSFEPAPGCWPHVEAVAGERVIATVRRELYPLKVRLRAQRASASRRSKSVT